MEWISVKDKLPKDDEIVLCFVPNIDHAFVCEYLESTDNFYASREHLDAIGGYYTDGSMEQNYKRDEITHWMPLPKAPTK